MDSFQQGILTLIKCAITESPQHLPASFSLEAAEAFAAKQQLVPLVYTGALVCGIPAGEPLMQRMFQTYLKLTIHSERQMAAIHRLCRSFEENQIDYLLLKGCIMKPLYPKPELRYMGDADILIRMEQYPKIIPLMEALGYERKEETNHELPWNSQALFVELHKMLIPSYNKDYYAYFGDGWHFAKKAEGYRYVYSAEDDFIFQFSHFAKHYRNGGIGCRYVLDLWIFRRANPQLDESYIRTELKKLHLLEFYENILRLIQAWFEDGAMDEKLEFMTQVIFSGGSWGSWEKRILVQETHSAKVTGSRTGRTLKLLLRKILPPLSEMKWHYPLLEKQPWLLPVLWIVRLADILLFKRHKIRKTQSILKEATDDKLRDYHKSLQYVGLDFHFD